MRLPLRVAEAIRTRHLIAPKQHVVIALSGGPDSVALMHCMHELSRKRDLAFSLSAAHLNHGIRGRDADTDESFCRTLCESLNVPLVLAFADTPSLAKKIKRSIEETARIARHTFLAAAAKSVGAHCVAVAHHADDRIETVLYRLCRGTGLAGLQGIGWTGPLILQGEPDVSDAIQWRETQSNLPRDFTADCAVVRPMLECSRQDILAYLELKKQNYCTDETNFDSSIPRNALRNIVLPLLEEKVHPCARMALWRLAEESESNSESQHWRREWLRSFSVLAKTNALVLPVSRGSLPSVEECSDVLEVLRTFWNLQDAHFTIRHAQALRELFEFTSGPKSLDLPSQLIAERRHKQVLLHRRIIQK